MNLTTRKLSIILVLKKKTLKFKGKKLSRSPLSKSLLYKNGNIFASDQRNSIIYSVENNSILQKFNFYKKYKSLKKIINILIEETQFLYLTI